MRTDELIQALAVSIAWVRQNETLPTSDAIDAMLPTIQRFANDRATDELRDVASSWAVCMADPEMRVRNLLYVRANELDAS